LNRFLKYSVAKIIKIFKKYKKTILSFNKLFYNFAGEINHNNMKREISIGEIVALDFRAASVFKEAGIDFCCGGKMSLEKACKEKGIDMMEVEHKLTALESAPSDEAHNFKDWDPGFLCDYIVNAHHKYVLKSLPELVFYTGKISSVHGERHPELTEVASLFADINRELLQHLKNEEEVLFPAIKEYLSSGSGESKAVIIKQISKLSAEHEFAGGAMDKINTITLNYKVPADGCNTYIVSFRLLQQFEDDLHVHVHLENNVLFPNILKSIN
jgi:regulator of cell morphogenesis and NO signaling